MLVVCVRSQTTCHRQIGEQLFASVVLVVLLLQGVQPAAPVATQKQTPYWSLLFTSWAGGGIVHEISEGLSVLGWQASSVPTTLVEEDF